MTYYVVEIWNTVQERGYVTITYREPWKYRKQFLRGIRQGWNGWRYEHANGPQLMVRDVEYNDYEHHKQRIKDGRAGEKDRGAMRPNNQPYEYHVHGIFNTHQEAELTCNKIIHDRQLWDHRYGYNQSFRNVEQEKPKLKKKFDRQIPTQDLCEPPLPDWTQDEWSDTKDRVTITKKPSELPWRLETRLDGKLVELPWPPKASNVQEFKKAEDDQN